MRTVLATNPNPDLYGASRMFLESVRGFTEAHWRVVACIPAPGPLCDEVAALGGEVRSVPSPTLRKTLLNPLGLLRLAWMTLQAIPAGVRVLRDVRPDVVYVNTITEPLWPILAWCLRIPVVSHDHEAESSAPRLMQQAMALPLLCARRIIINSEFSAGVLVRAMPALESRCEVVLNGVRGPEVKDLPRNSLEGTVHLVFVGRISERKGVEDAVAAVAVLRQRGIDAVLDVLGSVFPGYEHVEAALRKRIETSGIADRVHLRGFERDVWKRLSAADVMVVPSRVDEPFGNTAVEGILALRPVIATRTGGLVEAVGDYDSTILVSPSAPEEIADSVEKIVDNWASFAEAAIRDEAVASERHSPDRFRHSIVETCTRVLV